MAAQALGYIKLKIEAGKANPAPPVGPALGQRGLNIMDFCKAFNERTKGYEAGTPVSVVITYYSDRTFTFILKGAPVSFLLKKASGVASGSKTPGRGGSVGVVTKDQCIEIAKEKMNDLNAYNVEAAVLSVMGTARSMGLKVEG